MSRVGVIGEALMDIVRRPDGSVHTAPGGSPANVALTLGRLGMDVRLFTSLGQDASAKAIRTWLGESRVDVFAAEAERTSTAIACLDATGAAQYEFDLVWEARRMRLDGCGLLHVGSVTALLAPGADEVLAAAQAARPSALITYDPNIRPALLIEPRAHRDRVERLVALADVVKASDEDLDWLYPGVDPLDVARGWRRRGEALVVVTRGGAGADAATSSGVVHVEPPSVVVADTVGAGDTFMGTLIAELVTRGYAQHGRAALRGVDVGVVRSMLEASARAAAVTVSRPGADPPWGEGVRPLTRIT